MKTPTRKPPKVWDRIERQYLSTLAAAYGAPKDRAESKRGAERLASLMNQVEDGQGSILGQDSLALIAEIRGNLGASAEHRLKSAALITQLLSSGYPLHDYGWDDVAERFTLAALDYDRMGELRKAMKCLRQAEVVCRQHGLPFDGKQLVDELVSSAVDAKATAANPSRSADRHAGSARLMRPRPAGRRRGTGG